VDDFRAFPVGAGIPARINPSACAYEETIKGKESMSISAALKSAVRSRITRGPVPLEKFQEIRMEGHLALVRLRRRIDPTVRANERTMRRLTDIQLHFGCGGRILPGWLNVDAWGAPGVDFLTDLRQPLPLADGSCRLIFTEHVFEHIDQNFRLGVLREFRRLLAPGGTMRINVPDCELHVNAYVNGDLDWFATVFGENLSNTQGINSIFMDHFHRFIDDWDSLSTALKEAGFTVVTRSSCNGSAIPELRIDTKEPSRSICSLYVEAQN
jgi:predicted SAM-dependent methyltransferase